MTDITFEDVKTFWQLYRRGLQSSMIVLIQFICVFNMILYNSSPSINQYVIKDVDGITNSEDFNQRDPCSSLICFGTVCVCVYVVTYIYLLLGY